MGVVIQDKTSRFDDAFDAIISAARDAIAICYCGTGNIQKTIRLSEYNALGVVGAMAPTGEGATVPPGAGIIAAAGLDANFPTRFVFSWQNRSAKCALLVVAAVKNGGGIFSFAGTRVRLDSARKLGVKALDGMGRDMAEAVPEGALCYFLNSNESAYQVGYVTALNDIKCTRVANDDKKFTAADKPAYLGGIGYGISGFRGPNTFYCAAAFDRYLTDTEIKAQAQQLIKYANSLDAGVQ